MTSTANRREPGGHHHWAGQLADARAVSLAFIVGKVAPASATTHSTSTAHTGVAAAEGDTVRASHPCRGLLLAGLIPVALIAAACGGDSSATTTPASPRSSSAPSSTATPSASTDESAGATSSINPQTPLTQAVDARFDPPFTLRIPARWTAVLRDRSAFQVYAGNEDFEITFDHTYRSKESVGHAIARLLSTDGLTPGRVSNVVIGDRHGKGFVASSTSAVQFVDSGFHTSQGSRLEVFAIPAKDGTTVTVFLTAEGNLTHGLDALGPMARRIFKTVAWQ